MGRRKAVDDLNPQALLAQAQKAIATKNWQQALQSFEAILGYLRRRKGTTKMAKVAALLGYAQCLLALQRALEAEKATRQALRLDPENPEARQLHLSALLALGQWQIALRQAKRWVAEHPSDWRPHLLLARLYHTLNDQELSRFHLLMALHHGREVPSVFHTVAQLLEQQGRVQEAITVMRKAVHDFPDDATSWITLGLLLQKERKLRRALQCLERAIELGGDAPTVRLALGQICSDLGRMDKAIAHIQKGLEQDPDNLELWDLLSFVYLQQGKLREALGALHRLLDLAPTDPFGHFKLASLHYQMGNYAEAVQAYRRVIALAPSTELAQEAQEILEMVDHVQLEQVFVLSMEDPVFRARLIRDPKWAVESKGFALSDASLEILANTDFSRLPKRWRSPQGRLS
jgi:tetratricopeptide (TPR) repeat protein